MREGRGGEAVDLWRWESRLRLGIQSSIGLFQAADALYWALREVLPVISKTRLHVGLFSSSFQIDG